MSFNFYHQHAPLELQGALPLRVIDTFVFPHLQHKGFFISYLCQWNLDPGALTILISFPSGWHYG